MLYGNSAKEIIFISAISKFIPYSYPPPTLFFQSTITMTMSSHRGLVVPAITIAIASLASSLLVASIYLKKRARDDDKE